MNSYFIPLVLLLMRYLHKAFKLVEKENNVGLQSLFGGFSRLQLHHQESNDTQVNSAQDSSCLEAIQLRLFCRHAARVTTPGQHKPRDL